jgi:acyl-CoA reductase-like NAD-dependent aldehyde dehydrogenase
MAAPRNNTTSQALYKNFIGGKWADADRTGEVINPCTETVIERVPLGTSSDLQQAIEAAHNAFSGWKSANAWQRSDLLRKVATLMREGAADLAAVTVAEAGKPLAEATGEWLVAAQFFDWYAEEGKRAGGHTLLANRNNKRMMVIHQPLGVTGIITAWNFPVWNLARAWAAALAAGCTIVAKPSEYTPLTAMQLMGLIEKAGIPPGVANLVLADADMVGQALLDHPAVRKIHFVGSTRVGKILMDGASRTHTRLSLELGGNAPCIILPDVDIPAVGAAAALAKSRNCGQVCVSPQRFLVHRSVYADFCTATAAALQQLRLGNGMDPATQLGPLINARQRDHVAATVQDSLRQGGTLLCGGQRPAHLPTGYFYEPTLVSDVEPHHALFRREIFGPVMSATPFDHPDEAIALANDTEYGLAAYLWTNDLKASVRISEALEFGIVGINEWAAHAVEAPFGGWKQSGQGYECGAEGLYEYLEKKLISTGV